MTGHPCCCGEVHELSAEVRAIYEKVTRGLSPTVRITTGDGTWNVPRIYLAVHGIKGAELPDLADKYRWQAVI